MISERVPLSGRYEETRARRTLVVRPSTRLQSSQDVGGSRHGRAVRRVTCQMTLVCSCGGLRGEVRICEGEAYLLHLDPAEARGHVGARARSLLQDGRHELFALVYQDAVVHERLSRVQSVMCMCVCR